MTCAKSDTCATHMRIFGMDAYDEHGDVHAGHVAQIDKISVVNKSRHMSS